eukprot:GHVN01031214.1.p1 GENE.GHVN01031214.1~~GHVN01031214.1.p1  ORF type:complete len:281 (-),score=24.25 GHVN01031214.1:251-1093(-)
MILRRSLSFLSDRNSLKDGFGRVHDYLRISLTEKCNLRCSYCMPPEGVDLTPSPSLLTTDEIYRLANVFVKCGVRKIRLTGGEPTVRPDFQSIVLKLGEFVKQGSLDRLAVTSNGLTLYRHVECFKHAGVTDVNISLDTLDPLKFHLITRRNGFRLVAKSIRALLEANIATVKLNCVVVRGFNDEEMSEFVHLTRHLPLEVRFIEVMPFPGNGWSPSKTVSFKEMLTRVTAHYPHVEALPARNLDDTAKLYRIPGHVGQVGFITSVSRPFCGGCSRIRSQ